MFTVGQFVRVVFVVSPDHRDGEVVLLPQRDYTQAAHRSVRVFDDDVGYDARIGVMRMHQVGRILDVQTGHGTCYEVALVGHSDAGAMRTVWLDPDEVRNMAECALPPEGWRCTRVAWHDGPCAAVEVDRPGCPSPSTCGRCKTHATSGLLDPYMADAYLGSVNPVDPTDPLLASPVPLVVADEVGTTACMYRVSLHHKAGLTSASCTADEVPETVARLVQRWWRPDWSTDGKFVVEVSCREPGKPSQGSDVEGT